MTPRTGGKNQDAVIVGGGRFGCLAAKRLGKKARLVVEPEPSFELMALGIPVIKGDGIALAAGLIKDSDPPGWVVPTLPRHFLAKWLCLELAALAPKAAAIPEGCIPEVPSVHPGREGQVYLSLADFLCPDDCPEPAEICTVTKNPRGRPLHERLAAISADGWSTGVLASRQLAPGVGGLAVDDLLRMKQRVAARGGGWLLGTACKCHGVLQALCFSKV